MTVKAQKHLGQHFITDEETSKNLAESFTEFGYENILENGPVMGLINKYF